MSNQLFDVIEIEIMAPHSERIFARRLSQEKADEFIKIAVFRRGVETHFYTKRATGACGYPQQAKERALRIDLLPDLDGKGNGEGDS